MWKCVNAYCTRPGRRRAGADRAIGRKSEESGKDWRGRKREVRNPRVSNIIGATSSYLGAERERGGTTREIGNRWRESGAFLSRGVEGAGLHNRKDYARRGIGYWMPMRCHPCFSGKRKEKYI